MKTANVIIPTYNESGNIIPLVERLHKVDSDAIPNYRLEILVVDDNSPDGTGELVSKVKRRLPRLHLIKGNKQGLGKAYIRGFRHALKKIKPDVVVMMDADFSHDPKAIPKLLKAIDRGGDYVIGSRYTSGGSIPGNWPLRRILNSRVANFVATKVGGIDPRIKDISGGFKAIKTSALKNIALDEIKIHGYAFQMLLLNEFVKRGFKVVEVPITFNEREAGVSKMRIADIVEFLKCAYQLSPSSPFKQLLKFGVVGLSGIAVNLLALYMLKNYTGLPLIVSSALAIEASIISNFILHTSYTFRSEVDWQSGIKPAHLLRQSLFKKLAAFNAATLGMAGVTLIMFTFLNKYGGVHYLLAQTLAIAAAFIGNYWISRRYIWRASEPV